MPNRNIVPDNPCTEIPLVGHEDYYELNYQTAYNKKLISNANKCGCFYCGNTFTTHNIKEYIKEDNGEDTALCPFCGNDTVIVGSKEFPLSTALLSLLYMFWFEAEYKKRKKYATNKLKFRNYEDYLRKGIPFLYDKDHTIKIVGKIELYPLEFEGSSWREDLGDILGVDVTEENTNYNYGGVVTIQPYYTDSGYFVAEFITDDEERYPYKPQSGSDQYLLECLVEKYGASLKGLIKDGGAWGEMELFINIGDKGDLR